MSAYKQAGISLNRALAIAAKTVRNSLKAEYKVAAEKRGFTEVKVSRFENGEPTEAKALENDSTELCLLDSISFVECIETP
ncbi:hypothetical protein JCM33374_g2435 [Metschnikowia sp. JCM 33374]|nr:hypothetical protein JCM33374_g2435 [Metschnikowia sp. JCM 33374]